MLITDTFPAFYAAKSQTIRSSRTRQKWTLQLRGLQYRYPNKQVSELTTEDLTSYLLLDDGGSTRTVCGGTVLTNRTILRSYFRWARFAGLVEVDPSADLVMTVQAKAQPTRQHHWLDSSQITACFEASGTRDSVVLGLGIFVGLRLHELCKVRWSDLSPNFGTVYVLGKGGKAATLPVPKQLKELLEEWRDTSLAQGSMTFEGSILHPMRSAGWEGRETYVEWDKPLGMSGARAVVHAAGAKIGVPELSPHDLRRTYASLLEDAGVPMRAISGLMRHSSIATTEKYLSDNSSTWADSVSNAMNGISLGGQT